MLWLVVVAVELLIFMCVNKLLASTGDPPDMIYPAGYGSGENSPPIVGMGILAVSIFYDRYGSGVAIPDKDLPIAISVYLSTHEPRRQRWKLHLFLKRRSLVAVATMMMKGDSQSRSHAKYDYI